MINRLRELLRYDLARQATIAFAIGFVASTSSFRAGTSMVGEEVAALSGEGRGRYLASVVASRDARPIGKAAAAADLAGLLESGDHDEAYDQAFEFATRVRLKRFLEHLRIYAGMLHRHEQPS